MLDWIHPAAVLLQGSRSAFRDFFAVHPIDQICAVGFVIELGSEGTYMEPCADTRAHRKVVWKDYSLKYPHMTKDEMRWNSGEYEFPAGLLRHDELGPAWAQVAEALQRTAGGGASEEVCRGLISLCCDTIVTLSAEGAFGNWADLDFNVAEVEEPTDVVKERDAAIRRRLRGAA